MAAVRLAVLVLAGCLLASCTRPLTRSGVYLEVPPDTMGVCAAGDRFLDALKGLQVDDPKDYVAGILGEPADRRKAEWYYSFIEDAYEGGYTLHATLTFAGDRLRTAVVQNGHVSREPVGREAPTP